MPFFTVRRTLLCLFALICASARMFAYPVSYSINTTLVSIPGDRDDLNLGTSGVTATITTTLESANPPGAGVTSATYPASVVLNVPGVIGPLTTTGTVTISDNGQLTADFSGTAGSFTATVVLTGVTFPAPVPLAFGTANFTSPASSLNYNLDGAIGTVGINGTVSATGLNASPTSITASYTVGGSAPAPQTVSINDSATAAQYSVSLSPSSTTFVTLNSTSGTTSGSVQLTFSTSVAPGTYTANLLINTTADTSGAPLSIPITYTVSPGSGTFFVTPSLTFNLPSSTAETLPITISLPSGTASYTASLSGPLVTSSPGSVTLSATQGTAPGSINVTVDSKGLAAGTYSASVLVSVAGFSPVTVSLNVTVTSSGSTGGSGPITPNPPALTFNVDTAGAAVASQTVQLTSATPVSFTISNISFYLPVSPVSGTTPATLTVGVNSSTLTNGTYSDTLKIVSGSSTIDLPVTVYVGPQDNISLNTYLLSYTAATQADVPAAQTITVNSSTATQFTFTATPSDPWITVTPTSATTPGSFQVTVDPSGLPVGTSSGTVTISAPDVHNSPQVVRINVNVQGSAVTQSLSSTPAAVAFAYQAGGTAPASQTVQLASSAAGASLAYTESTVGESWLSATVDTTNNTVTISADPTGLAAGVYTGSIKLVGMTYVNSPLYIPVTLTVSGVSAIGVGPASLSFGGQPGAAAPASQALAVSSSTAGDTVAIASDSPWLTVSSSSVTAPGVVLVSVTPGNMAAGIYTGHLTLTGTASGTATVTVTFALGTVSTPVLSAVTSAISYLTSAPETAGNIVALFGTGLGPTPGMGLQLDSSGTLVQDTAGGTEVYASGIPCPILYSSSGQVNAVLPFGLAGQASADVWLVYDGVASNTINVALAPAAPALFSAGANGSGPGAILNFVANAPAGQDLTLNTQANPAPAGSIIVLYGGGAGVNGSATPDGEIIPQTAPFPMPVGNVSVSVGGVPATVQYAGSAPGLVAGVLQVNVQLGPGTPSGAQPVVLNVDDVPSQDGLTVFVQ